MRRWIYGALIALTIIGLWFWRHGHDKQINQRIHSTNLPANDAAKVIVDPARHSIITVTRDATGHTKTRATFLPRTGASVELRRNGSLVVTALKWGTEVNPFLGGAFGSDIRLRAALGVNLLYVQRWELGGGALFDSRIDDTRLFVHVSYNPYANYYVALGVDNRRTLHVMAGLKF